MLDDNMAKIRADVRAIAAQELVDREVAADLFFRTKVLPRNLQRQDIRTSQSTKPFVRDVFGSPYDEKISSELRKLFPMGLNHLTDQLEAHSLLQHPAIQDNKTGAFIKNAMPYHGARKKTWVEECFVLDVDLLESWGLLWPNTPRLGFLVLFKTLTGAPLLCMWEINRSSSSSSLGLTYRVPGSEEVETSTVEISLSKGSPKQAATQAWLKCPHKNDVARECPQSKRLYLPPGAKKFACNRCYDLDYHRRRSMAGLHLSVPFFFLFPLRRRQ